GEGGLGGGARAYAPLPRPKGALRLGLCQRSEPGRAALEEPVPTATARSRDSRIAAAQLTHASPFARRWAPAGAASQRRTLMRRPGSERRSHKRWQIRGIEVAHGISEGRPLLWTQGRS